MLQCVAVCCSVKVYRSYGNDVSRLVSMCVLQCVAVCRSVSQRVVLQCVVVQCGAVYYVAVRCGVLFRKGLSLICQ